MKKTAILKKAPKQYKLGHISIDKAAEMTGLAINEIMQEAAARGIRSDESLEEFRVGLRLSMEK